MNFRRFLAATWARSLEFLRDRSALGWNFAFPLIMVAGMATIFAGPERPVFVVAVTGAPAGTALDARLHPFLATEGTRFYREEKLDDALPKVQRHRVDLLLDLSQHPPRYWVNTLSNKGKLLEKLLLAADPAAQRQTVTGTVIRLVDWLAPGVLAVNLMFSCLFGIGYVVVRYRKTGYLKRLNATPLRALEFICAQLLSRLLLILLITVVVFAGSNSFLHFRMEGSYLDLFVVAALGAMSIIALSLVVAARFTSEELSGGVLNMLSWPMLALSGVFYSVEGSPHAVQVAAKIFPLTHMLDAARAIMLDGADLAGVRSDLLVLGAMTVGFLAIGAAGFRWTQD